MAIAAKDKTIIAVTGDRHRSGIYQNQDLLKLQPHPLIEQHLEARKMIHC